MIIIINTQVLSLFGPIYMYSSHQNRNNPAVTNRADFFKTERVIKLS